MIIAIDGPAAAGKGTLARRIADALGYAHLDTGALYRAVGLAVRRAGNDPADADAALAAAKTLDPAGLSDPALREEETSKAASIVSAHPAVRAALLDFQRQFAQRPPQNAQGAVVEGRDIGTVVCPDAPIKIFLTASVEVRADRRVKELQQRGEEAIRTRILRDMQDRDTRDKSRSVAPLEPAKEAFVLDTSELDADAAFAAALDYIASQKRT